MQLDSVPRGYEQATEQIGIPIAMDAAQLLVKHKRLGERFNLPTVSIDKPFVRRM